MWIPALNMDTVIISCIMPLVPGVAITNANAIHFGEIIFPEGREPWRLL